MEYKKSIEMKAHFSKEKEPFSPEEFAAKIKEIKEDSPFRKRLKKIVEDVKAELADKNQSSFFVGSLVVRRRGEITGLTELYEGPKRFIQLYKSSGSSLAAREDMGTLDERHVGSSSSAEILGRAKRLSESRIFDYEDDTEMFQKCCDILESNDKEIWFRQNFLRGVHFIGPLRTLVADVTAKPALAHLYRSRMLVTSHQNALRRIEEHENGDAAREYAEAVRQLETRAEDLEEARVREKIGFGDYIKELKAEAKKEREDFQAKLEKEIQASKEEREAFKKEREESNARYETLTDKNLETIHHKERITAQRDTLLTGHISRKDEFELPQTGLELPGVTASHKENLEGFIPPHIMDLRGKDMTVENYRLRESLIRSQVFLGGDEPDPRPSPAAEYCRAIEEASSPKPERPSLLHQSTKTGLYARFAYSQHEQAGPSSSLSLASASPTSVAAVEMSPASLEPRSISEQKSEAREKPNTPQEQLTLSAAAPAVRSSSPAFLQPPRVSEQKAEAKMQSSIEDLRTLIDAVYPLPVSGEAMRYREHWLGQLLPYQQATRPLTSLDCQKLQEMGETLVEYAQKTLTQSSSLTM